MVVVEKHAWLFFAYPIHQKTPQPMFGVLFSYQLIDMKTVPLLAILLLQAVFHTEIAAVWDSSTGYHESALFSNWICVEYCNLL